jgi:hypothetical protein
LRGDSKRKVVCILFIIPPSKSGSVEAPMEGDHGQTSSSIYGGHGELVVRGGRGREESSSGCGCPWRWWKGTHGGGGAAPGGLNPGPAVHELLYRLVWERKNETRKRNKKRGKRKRRKKMWKKIQTWNFLGEK